LLQLSKHFSPTLVNHSEPKLFPLHLAHKTERQSMFSCFCDHRITKFTRPTKWSFYHQTYGRPYCFWSCRVRNNCLPHSCTVSKGDKSFRIILSFPFTISSVKFCQRSYIARLSVYFYFLFRQETASHAVVVYIFFKTIFPYYAWFHTFLISTHIYWNPLYCCITNRNYAFYCIY